MLKTKNYYLFSNDDTYLEERNPSLFYVNERKGKDSLISLV